MLQLPPALLFSYYTGRNGEQEGGGDSNPDLSSRHDYLQKAYSHKRSLRFFSFEITVDSVNTANTVSKVMVNDEALTPTYGNNTKMNITSDFAVIVYNIMFNSSSATAEALSVEVDGVDYLSAGVTFFNEYINFSESSLKNNQFLMGLTGEVSFFYSGGTCPISNLVIANDTSMVMALRTLLHGLIQTNLRCKNEQKK